MPRTNDGDPVRSTRRTFWSVTRERWYDVSRSVAKRLSRGRSSSGYTFLSPSDTTRRPRASRRDTNQNVPNSASEGFSGSYAAPVHAERQLSLPSLRAHHVWVLALAGGRCPCLQAASCTPSASSRHAAETSTSPVLHSLRPVFRPRVIGHGSSTTSSCWRRAAFRSATLTDSIDDIVPRNAFFTPGTRNVDLALAKNFQMPWQGQILSVRIEAFNAFNIVKFGFPTNDITNVNFGRILAGATSYSPRVVQLVLRYRY